MSLSEFITALNAKFAAAGLTFEAMQGAKFARIVRCDAQRSAFCFVDADGNVYKAASWKAPAKGIRATLATLDMSRVDQYGSWLYCR